MLLDEEPPLDLALKPLGEGWFGCAGQQPPDALHSFLDIPLPQGKESPFPFIHKGWALVPSDSERSLVLLTTTSSIPEALHVPLASLFEPMPLPNALSVLLSTENTMAAGTFVLDH
ncbi:hypothetical protein IQ216_03855 [Cyanobium sp. LEGE 06143]|uniref:hypothetical protein n=1 Tax=Cyanobium sp. LEGE 06143 TaxID=945727 RepID=UPI001881BE62|nr:hypothetical protein [Cyanobium sp. LEGE 06143]MBE9172244.1 hypothetical protein [Cyanobium sp. LEGE 06143]